MGAFNGSGVFVRSYNWTQDAANSIDITASRMDTEDTGFASGLSLCVTRDGQGAMTANFLPSVDATYDLGSATFHWVNLWLSGNATIGGNATVAGTLNVTGAATLSSLTLGGNTLPSVITLVKSSTTSRSNNTTATADPTLQVALSTGTYSVEVWINDNGGTSNGGLKGTIAYTGSNSSASLWGMVGSGVNTTNVPLVTVNVAAQQMQTTQGGQGNMWITGILTATGSGTLSFSWAQNSSNATASVVASGSWMRVTKLA